MIRNFTTGFLIGIAVLLAALSRAGADDQFFDSHFHLTNYVQEGPSMKEHLTIMGKRVGRSTVFGIPLTQQWAYSNSGTIAPKYYLDSDAPLYYYSFTDAVIAEEFLRLSPAERAHFDPMITGFNPADMYAPDHIRRVLTMYPGVFTGIGEFTVHKEFVSAKTAGGPASLLDPALDRILDFAGETGLLVLIHNDIQTPFRKPETETPYIGQMVALLKRHPKTRIIWAHMGLGRIVQPFSEFGPAIENILDDPALSHVSFDISWEEVAKYLNATPQSAERTAKVINRHADRFLFGTDEVASREASKYFRVFDLYASVWKLLTPEASLKVRKKNYERLFDEARAKVRAWEKRQTLAVR